MHAKTKNAMLDKSQRDLEQARRQIGRCELEIENLKAQLTKARYIKDNQAVLESPSIPRRSTSPRKSPPVYNTSQQYSAEKENRVEYSDSSKTGIRTMSAAELGIKSPSIETNGSLAGGTQNWKNAADLTARLRERIESMKKAERQR